MMSTTAGGETSSDGREVIMIVQEKEKTDAEMTGMTGIQLKTPISLNLSQKPCVVKIIQPLSPILHVNECNKDK